VRGGCREFDCEVSLPYGRCNGRGVTYSFCSCSRRATACALHSSRISWLLVVMVSSNLMRILRYLRLSTWSALRGGSGPGASYLHERFTGCFCALSAAVSGSIFAWSWPSWAALPSAAIAMFGWCSVVLGQAVELCRVTVDVVVQSRAARADWPGRQ
jgi:hypothetical protein